MNIQRIDDMIMNVTTNNIDIRNTTLINVIIIPTNTTITNIRNDVKSNTRISISIEFIITTIISNTTNNSMNKSVTCIIIDNAIITDIMNSINTPYWK